MTEWKLFYTDLVQKAATSPKKPFESVREDATTDVQANRDMERQKVYF